MMDAFSAIFPGKSWIASMRIHGEWHLYDDGVVRPIVRGQILTGTTLWQAAEFLVDTGADRTVFSAPVLAAFRLQPVVSPHRLSGVGGMANAVFVETRIRFSREGDGKVTFLGQYAAVTELEALTREQVRANPGQVIWCARG
jgi:hypothetical protein